MRIPRFAPAAVAGALLISAGGFLSQPHSDRDGQILFAPWESLAAASADAEVARITIDSCAQADGGLEVRGHIDAGPGVTAVLVTPGRRTDAGVAVGSSFAGRAGLLPGAGPGGFRIVLAWGSARSRFAVAAHDALAGDPADVRHGAVAGCP